MLLKDHPTSRLSLHQIKTRSGENGSRLICRPNVGNRNMKDLTVIRMAADQAWLDADQGDVVATLIRNQMPWAIDWPSVEAGVKAFEWLLAGHEAGELTPFPADQAGEVR